MGCEKHAGHEHVHGPGCGHQAVVHGDHVDYVHDGCLHHPHDDHVDEHRFAVDADHPDGCAPVGVAHHTHGPGCGHESVPHGDHADYLVDGRLHHSHGDHCDDHGEVASA